MQRSSRPRETRPSSLRSPKASLFFFFFFFLINSSAETYLYNAAQSRNTEFHPSAASSINRTNRRPKTRRSFSRCRCGGLGAVRRFRHGRGCACGVPDSLPRLCYDVQPLSGDPLIRIVPHPPEPTARDLSPSPRGIEPILDVQVNWGTCAKHIWLPIPVEGKSDIQLHSFLQVLQKKRAPIWVKSQPRNCVAAKF